MPEYDQDQKRDEYNSFTTTLMSVTAGNRDHASGEQVAVLTVAIGDSIRPYAFDLRDAKTMSARLLVILATYKDQFARKLLDENFPTDRDGQFIWPKAEDGDGVEPLDGQNSG